MAGTTISTDVHNSVTLGTSSYPAPLTIAASGIILSSVSGAAGLISTLVADASIANNDGIVLGAAGATGDNGGIALIASDGAIISNIGQFNGGAGGEHGGSGGAGISIFDGTAFINSNYYGPTLQSAVGTVTGGTGGTGTAGGTGGAGAIINDATLSNLESAIIAGGAGGDGTSTSGAGGTGIVLNGGSFLNAGGTIIGGEGGTGAHGGAGAILTNGVMYNWYGNVLGGDGVTGGTGVLVQGGTLINHALIEGGNHGTANAISFTGTATLALTGYGTILGNIIADTGAADVLVLEDSVSSGLYLGGLGTSIQNFSNLDFASGSAWTVAGSEAGLTSGLTLSGFTSMDELILTGVTATTASYVTGTGIVLGTGAGDVTIDVSGSFAGQTVYFSNVAGNVDLLVGATVSTLSGNTLQLSGFTPLGTTLAAGSLLNITLLDVTDTGFIDVAKAGGDGIDIVSHQMAVLNSGTIMGGPGADGTAGGIGVLLSGDMTLTNMGSGLIVGGNANASSSGFGQDGGIGASLSGTLMLENEGTISGGAGGRGTSLSGAGGTGLIADGAGGIGNLGTISGGVGASGSMSGGAGGIGAQLAGSASLDNQGLITGGDGNSGSQTLGGAGGIGLLVTGGNNVLNEGKIDGGNGNYGGDNAGDGGAGVGFSGSGTFTNTGDIQGGNGALNFHINGNGDGGAGLSVTGSGVFINDGLIKAGDGPLRTQGGVGAFISSGTLVNAGTITPGASVSVAVTFGADAAELVIDPGAVFNGNVVANASVADTLALSGATAVTLAGVGTQFLNFADIDFETGAHWALEGTTLGLADGAAISGFASGDSIILDNFIAVGDSFGNGGLVLQGTTFGGSIVTAPVTLDIIGSFTTDDFILSVSTLGDSTTISLKEAVICFLVGTHILTAAGERTVESLCIGDEIVTRFGGMQRVKWIGQQSFAARFICNNRDQMPIRIEAGALGANIPSAALYVSPGHSMLIGDNLVLAKNLVNGISIIQPTITDKITYYAIELENHDCVLANGAWSESFADGPGLRNQFHNVAKFHELFPDYMEPETLSLCAPRPEAGPELEAALAPVLGRVRARPGRLRGFIDIAGPDKVEGWAWDESNPDMPVLLDIFAGESLLGNALACHYRPDLATAKLGRGHCMFTFALPAGFSGALNVRRSSDGCSISRTDACAAA